MILLSILMPSLYERTLVRETLIDNLREQIFQLKAEKKVQILTEIDNRELPTGTKRNTLVARAEGVWLSHVDDDDEPSDDYIAEVLKATQQNPDVINFKGYMTWDGNRKEDFTIQEGLPYVTITDAGGSNHYLRHTNHLSVIRASIARQIPFPELYTFEDHAYAVALKDSKLIKTEVFIDKSLYHYKYNSRK